MSQLYLNVTYEGNKCVQRNSWKISLVARFCPDRKKWESVGKLGSKIWAARPGVRIEESDKGVWTSRAQLSVSRRPAANEENHSN